MFDIGWSELLIVGFVALIVVGPKELPALLRTIGRYVGMIKRQAAEFRSQFDDAMRESDLAELRKEVEDIGHKTTETLRDTERTLQEEMDQARSSFEQDGRKDDFDDLDAHDENGVPVEKTEKKAEPIADAGKAEDAPASASEPETAPKAEKPVKSEA